MKVCIVTNPELGWDCVIGCAEDEETAREIWGDECQYFMKNVEESIPKRYRNAEIYTHFCKLDDTMTDLTVRYADEKQKFKKLSLEDCIKIIHCLDEIDNYGCKVFISYIDDGERFYYVTYSEVLSDNKKIEISTTVCNILNRYGFDFLPYY